MPKKVKERDAPASTEPMGRKEFERKLKPLHAELVKLQMWAQHAGLRVVIVFEGRDGQHRSFLELTPLVEQTIVDNGITLLKYWFEVSQALQSERFQERIGDGRKIWKLSGMDLESDYRWYDYSRARDAMFATTDTQHAPWWVINADDPRRVRLNCIAHPLSKIPYQELPKEKIRLADRQPTGGYVEPQWRRHVVPEVY
jgi:polyphosphate kinase 2 (PPK2 family)